MIDKIKSWAKALYHQIVEINDTPHRIAAGLSLGVFLGIFPGMGVIASVVMATLLRVNKAAAIAGSLLTNTWMSVLVLAAAVKIGGRIVGGNADEINEHWKELTTKFSWDKLLDGHLWQMVFPVLAGFVVICAVTGMVTYFVCYLVLHYCHQAKKA